MDFLATSGQKYITKWPAFRQPKHLLSVSTLSQVCDSPQLPFKEVTCLWVWSTVVWEYSRKESPASVCNTSTQTWHWLMPVPCRSDLILIVISVFKIYLSKVFYPRGILLRVTLFFFPFRVWQTPPPSFDTAHTVLISVILLSFLSPSNQMVVTSSWSPCENFRRK